MEITNSQAAATAAAATNSAAKDTVIGSDFETFLKMLTAQLENQDPLNPLDSQDFAVQLATFSGVEQAVKTNDLLENLGNLFNTSGLSELGNLIGKEVRVQAAAQFTGDPIDVIPSYDSAAETNEIIVRNAQGQIVDRFFADAKTDDIVEWTGVDNNGAQLPYGSYAFSTLGKANGDDLPELKAHIYAPVIEARLNGSTTQLVLPGEVTVEQSAVTGLRAAQ